MARGEMHVRAMESELVGKAVEVLKTRLEKGDLGAVRLIFRELVVRKNQGGHGQEARESSFGPTFEVDLGFLEPKRKRELSKMQPRARGRVGRAVVDAEVHADTG